MFFRRKPKELKRWHWIALAIILLFALGVKFYSHYWPKTIISLDGILFRVAVADTQDHLLKGMGDSRGWGSKEGMLFVFPGRRQHTMVMRDMNFPIDIVWIDSVPSAKKCFLSRFNLRKIVNSVYWPCEGVVVDMAPRVMPESGKAEHELTPYFARMPSTMVLELPAGTIDRMDLKIGDKFENTR